MDGLYCEIVLLMKLTDEDRIKKLFPNGYARKIADEHICTLSVQLQFFEFTDEWVSAYVKAGGTTVYVKT